MTDTGPPRDHYGRYLVPRIDGDDGRIPLTRATTVAKAPEDQAGLMVWEGRMVALGLAARPDLLSLVATTDPSDKTALNRLCLDAKEAGGATRARNAGTAVHASAEVVNRGHEPLPLFAAEMDSYRGALSAAGLVPVPELVERIVLDYDLGIAGTFDVALRDADGALWVGDIKTGSIAYPAAMAIQLAIYAGARHMLSTDYDTVEAAPGFNQTRGIIIHLPEGGPCSLHWIDLEAGARGLAVAMDVRKWRSEAKAKTLLTPIVESSGEVFAPPAVEPGGQELNRGTVAPVLPSSERVAWFAARYEAIRLDVPAEYIARAWPPGIPGPKRVAEMTPEQLEQALEALERLEDDHGLPFAQPDPATPAHEPRHPPAPAPAPAIFVDEGPPMAAEDVAALRRKFAALPKTAKDRVDQWVREGRDAGRPWAMGKDLPVTRRRWSAARVAIGLARRTEDDEIARGWVALIIGEDAAQTHPVGALIGSLSIEEADLLGTLCEAHKNFAGAVQALAA